MPPRSPSEGPRARPAVSEEARAVHEAALVIDLHADTPKFMSRGYDIYLRHRTPWPLYRYGGHVDLPRLREGNVAAQFFAMWTFPLPERGCDRDVHRQLAALEAAEQGGGLTLCRTADELVAARAAGKLAALCGIEGGHSLEAGDGRRREEALDRLAAFARRGVRYLGLLHFSRNALGAPAMGFRQDHGLGLTPLGCEVVDACSELGVIVDLAHINRRGFFDVVARRPGPLFVTHTGVAGVHPHWRNIDDEQLRAVADSGGVVGVIFAPRFLGQDGLEGVVAHLIHTLRVAGEDAVALGSDYDGFVAPPRALPDPSKLPHLTEALLRAGLSADQVHKLLGGNVLRVLRQVPPAA